MSFSSTISTTITTRCTAFDCKGGPTPPTVICKGTNTTKCGKALHKECAKGGLLSPRCASCYRKKAEFHKEAESQKQTSIVPPLAQCNFPKCSGSGANKHPCSTTGCNNELHHMCLAGSGVLPEYAEADSKNYKCFDCISKLTKTTKTVPPLGTSEPMERLARPREAPAKERATVTIAPAAINKDPIAPPPSKSTLPVCRSTVPRCKFAW